MTPRQQIAGALAAVSLESPLEASWFGATIPDLSGARQATDESDTKALMLSNLGGCLYGNFYTRGQACPLVGEDFSADSKPDARFVSRLAAAGSVPGRQQAGWDVLRVRGDWAWVRRDGMQALARIGEDCRVSDADEDSAPAQATVTIPRLLPSASPGFYVVHGPMAMTDQGRQLRVYANLRTSGAEDFLRLVPQVLEQESVPFLIKCLNRPRAYHRCDAGVVFIDGSDLELLRGVIPRLVRALGPLVKQPVPAMTLRVCDGVGVAWDPGGEESFGSSRCRLLAEAVWAGCLAPNSAGAAVLDDVEAAFAAEDIDIDEPWGRTSDPDLRGLVAGTESVCAVSFETPSTTCSPLDIAISIGEHLRRTSLRTDADGCTWIGGMPGPGGEGVIGADVVYEPIPGDVHSGTAGVAHFLGELFRATGEERFATLARASINSALRSAETIPPALRFGLYHGCVGIALVADRLAPVLEDEALQKRARGLVTSLTEEDLRAASPDLLTGLAGGLVGLLAMERDDVARPWAIAAADRLLETSEPRDGGRVWVDESHSLPLTGLSAGAAGIAYGLFTAWTATGEDRYADAAREAIEYEQAAFDPKTENWPDYRPSRDGEAVVRPHGLSWCQGAPGIAISRIAAWLATGDEVYAKQASTALRTTSLIVDVWLASGGGNYSLCHGLAGNTEILGIGASVLPDPDAPGWTARLERAVTDGANAYGVEAQTWPTGIGGDGTPSLMVGLAGTGLFYLRQHDPSVQSWIMP